MAETVPVPFLRQPAPMLNKSNTNASPYMVAPVALPEKPAVMSALKTAQYAPVTQSNKYAMLRAVMDKKFDTKVTLFASFISYQTELNKAVEAQLETRSAVMLAADMGLGKTVMALKQVNDSLNKGHRVLLVLAPGITKIWQAELKKYYKNDYAKVHELEHVITSKLTLNATRSLN